MISYASWSLSDHKKHYSATEKETHVVVFATDHFWIYFFRRNFTLVTDYSALGWLYSIDPKECIGRWVMDFKEYNLIMLHRASLVNGKAGALSCLPLQDPLPPLGDTIIRSPSTAYATTIIPGANL